MEGSPRFFSDKLNIQVKTGHEVLELDPPGQRIKVRRMADNSHWWEPYEQLALTTGASPITPPFPGIQAAGIHTANSIQSATAIRALMEEQKPKKAVVVGGGYIGLEMAEALLMQGLEVALVEMADEVMGTLDPDMGQMVSQGLKDGGVALHTGETVKRFAEANGKVTAVVTDKGEIPADLVVLGLGVKPNSELVNDSHIELGVKGAIRVNERMQTNVPGIWAAGDCAETFHLVSRRPVYVALATVAAKTGRVAGLNIGGEYATFPGVVGTAITKFQEMEIARTGLQESEIRALGWEYASQVVESATKVSYYPDVAPLKLKILAEKKSGRFLGAQIVGGKDAAKRIDTMAVCLHARFTVDQMLHLDLSYAPPYASVWEPLHIAVRKIQGKL